MKEINENKNNRCYKNMQNKMYCGDNDILPDGYTSFGSRYNCLRRGVGVGLSISKTRSQPKYSSVDQLDLKHLKNSVPRPNLHLYEKDSFNQPNLHTIKETTEGQPNYLGTTGIEPIAGVFPVEGENIHKIYRVEHDIPDIPMNTDSAIDKQNTTIVIPANHKLLKVSKYDHILRIFFAFLLSITLLYTIFSILKKLNIPLFINLLIVCMIGILFIVLFVYLQI
jgi:hypothetical protein